MSTSNTVRGSDADNFSVRSDLSAARVAQDCQPNKADAKDLSAQSSTLTDAEALELSSLESTVERSLKAFWEIGQALRQIPAIAASTDKTSRRLKTIAPIGGKCLVAGPTN